MTKAPRRKIHGLLLLDKASGSSSNQLLGRVKRFLAAEKAGHGGTLDPFASGVLPILLGEATKFSRYFLDADKHYQVRLRFGYETDTQDLTGNITREALPPQAVDWDAALSAFRGEITQIPPAYSALKVNGQRAYDLARRGENPELAARTVQIYALDCLEASASEALLAVHCSKGTYIRTLVQDLGRALGSAAHAIALRRTRVGHFDLSQSVTWEALQQQPEPEILPLSACLAHLPRLDLDARAHRYLRHGNDIAWTEALPEGCECSVFFNDVFLGIVQYRHGRLYPQRLCAHEEI